MVQKEGVTLTIVENRKSLAIRLAVMLALTYIFASLAIDSGSYWYYILAFVSIGIGFNAVGRLAKDYKQSYGKRTR